MSLQVLVRDKQGELIDELDIVEEVDTIQRHQQVGSWSLKCPQTRKSDELSQHGYGVSIRRNKKTLISGPWWQTEETRDPSKSIVISGYSDAIYLWDHIAYPCLPSGDRGPIFSASAYDQRSGNCETVIQDFFTFNNRPAPGSPPLSLMPNLLRGGNVVETARFAVLGDLLTSIAIHGGGLAFDVQDLQLVIYEPVDRRKEQVFSVESGNLQEIKSKMIAPTATHIVVAGGGQGTERVFVMKGDDALAERWGRRIEVFRDRRDTDDLVELEQTADEELFKQGERTELALSPIDLPNRTYGTNCGKSDLVTAEGIEGILSEVRITLNGSGEEIKPAVSTTATTGIETLLRRYDDALRTVRKRVESMERGL